MQSPRFPESLSLQTKSSTRTEAVARRSRYDTAHSFVRSRGSASPRLRIEYSEAIAQQGHRWLRKDSPEDLGKNPIEGVAVQDEAPRATASTCI